MKNIKKYYLSLTLAALFIVKSTYLLTSFDWWRLG
ncbi:quorum-sensing system DWW-type pheromone [Streptococcus orisratti]